MFVHVLCTEARLHLPMRAVRDVSWVLGTDRRLRRVLCVLAALLQIKEDYNACCNSLKLSRKQRIYGLGYSIATGFCLSMLVRKPA